MINLRKGSANFESPCTILHIFLAYSFNQSAVSHVTEQMRQKIACDTLSFHDTEVTESVSLDKSHKRVTYNSNVTFPVQTNSNRNFSQYSNNKTELLSLTAND